MASLFSLAEIRQRSEHITAHHGGVEQIDSRVVLALVAVVEAAQAVVAETLMCPAGHLDALEAALSKFEGAE